MPAVPAASRRDPVVTRRRWAERLDQFRRANQTVVQFCAAEGISVPSFHAWRRTLASEVKSPHLVTPAIVPIRLTPSPAGPPIELLFTSGTILRFPADTQPEVLAAVVRAVEGRSC